MKAMASGALTQSPVGALYSSPYSGFGGSHDLRGLLKRFPGMPNLLASQSAGAFNEQQQEQYAQMVYGALPGSEQANALRQIGLRLGYWRPKPHEPGYGLTNL
jgi:hypothetical protein